jgi:hypothetical protein
MKQTQIRKTRPQRPRDPDVPLRIVPGTATRAGDVQGCLDRINATLAAEAPRQP